MSCLCGLFRDLRIDASFRQVPSLMKLPGPSPESSCIRGSTFLLLFHTLSSLTFLTSRSQAMVESRPIQSIEYCWGAFCHCSIALRFLHSLSLSSSLRPLFLAASPMLYLGTVNVPTHPFRAPSYPSAASSARNERCVGDRMHAAQAVYPGDGCEGVR